MSSNTCCSGLSRKRGIQRLVWPARSPDLNPIENVWDALGEASCWSKLSSDKQEHSSVHSQRNGDKLPQQLLDNVEQKVWYNVWNAAPHPRSTYPVLIPFFKVPADI
ncbi:hypothetical protein TNCV_4102841 [Trichonephila clavipes]|nr:hypothetical protein TNCV_4102841 [Trichonephila clavipes]